MNSLQNSIIEWGNNLLTVIGSYKTEYREWTQASDQFMVCEWIKAAAEQYNDVPVSNDFQIQANAIRAKFVDILTGGGVL